MSYSSLILAVAIGQSGVRMFRADENYGKSAEQAVAMGAERWYDFIIEKAGAEHTLSMSHANYSYGCALHDVNDKMLIKVPEARRKIILSLRPKMQKFADEAISVGIVISGGGTMWTLIGSGNLAEVEGCVGDLISPSGEMKVVSQAQVWGKIAEAERRLVLAKPEVLETEKLLPYKYADAEASLKVMKFEWADALPFIAKISSAKERGRVMKVFYDSAETARWAGE